MYLVVSFCEDPSWDEEDRGAEAEILLTQEDWAWDWINRQDLSTYHKYTRFEVWGIHSHSVCENYETV